MDLMCAQGFPTLDSFQLAAQVAGAGLIKAYKQVSSGVCQWIDPHTVALIHSLTNYLKKCKFIRKKRAFRCRVNDSSGNICYCY